MNDYSKTMGKYQLGGIFVMCFCVSIWFYIVMAIAVLYDVAQYITESYDSFSTVFNYVFMI